MQIHEFLNEQSYGQLLKLITVSCVCLVFFKHTMKTIILD